MLLSIIQVVSFLGASLEYRRAWFYGKFTNQDGGFRAIFGFGFALIVFLLASGWLNRPLTFLV